MQRSEPVVPKLGPLSKLELHAKLMLGWTRAISRHGKGAFADKLECTGPGLNKQLAGSMPDFETIDKALDAEPSVLDDYLAAKGKRLVDAEAVCDVDDLGLLLARVTLLLQEAEHPDGPGGRAIVPQEYLAGEKVMRDLHVLTGRWLDRCGEIRKPRGVAA